MGFEQMLRSHIYRNLREMENYEPFSDGEPNAIFSAVNLAAHEQLLGVYWNTRHEPDALVITTVGLHILQPDQPPEFVSYGEIIHVRVTDEQYAHKRLVDKLVLHTAAKAVVMPVKGGGDKFRDAWEFMRFLDRVMASYRKHSEGANAEDQ